MSIMLNKTNHTVDTKEKSSRLTPREFDILEYLMEKDGVCASPEEIYAQVWQAEPFACRQVIAVHIRHIREKIETDPSNPAHVKMTWGKGYRYVN